MAAGRLYVMFRGEFEGEEKRWEEPGAVEEEGTPVGSTFIQHPPPDAAQDLEKHAPASAVPARKKSNPQSSTQNNSPTNIDLNDSSIAACSKRKVWIFVCTDATRSECVQRRLFGCTAPKHVFGDYRDMRPGDVLYLSNNTQETIEGPFVAKTKITRDLVPEAWGGKYPWQVQVDKLGENIVRVPKVEVYADDRLFRLQSPHTAPKRGFIHPKKTYTLNEGQHLSLLLLLEQKGYKDGCGGSKVNGLAATLAATHLEGGGKEEANPPSQVRVCEERGDELTRVLTSNRCPKKTSF